MRLPEIGLRSNRPTGMQPITPSGAATAPSFVVSGTCHRPRTGILKAPGQNCSGACWSDPRNPDLSAPSDFVSFVSFVLKQESPIMREVRWERMFPDELERAF